jgi:hypothetical protein
MTDFETVAMLGFISSGREPGEFGRCPECGEYSWRNVHECPPIFYVRNEDEDPEDALKIRAEDHEKAAEKFFDKSFYGGDSSSGEMTVIVRDIHDLHEWTINVSMEMVPSFTSEVIKTKEIDQETE